MLIRSFICLALFSTAVWSGRVSAQDFPRLTPDMFAGLSAVGSSRPASPDPRRIDRIEIAVEFPDGTPSDGARIRDLIELREGEDYSPSRIRQTILKIHQSGRAVNVQVFLLETDRPDTVGLRFSVTRPLRVGKVFFPGSGTVSDEELRPRLAGLELGAAVSERVIEESVQTLRGLYRDRGYFQASIEPHIGPPDPDGNADVTFQITPGTQARFAAPLQIIGDLRIDKKKVEESLRIKPGTPYTAEDASADVQRLRRLHLDLNYLNPRISEPGIDWDPKTDTVTVSASVDSGPLVDLKIEGYDISDKDRRAVLPVLREGGLDDFVLEEGQRNLLNFMQSKGYFFAQVEYAPTIFPDKATVVYMIDKGQRYRVRQIQVLGTPLHSYLTLAGEFESRIAGSFPPSRGLTSETALDADAALIERKLRNQGYLQARVTERRFGVSPDNENLEVIFVVDQGQQTLVERIEFAGNSVFSSEKLAAELPRRTADAEYFSQQRVSEDVNRLFAVYEEAGYAGVDIKPRIERTAPDRVKLTFTVSEGKKVFINNIIITVRGRTKRESIRHYLPFKEGDLLRQSKISQAEQVLYSTGAFKQVIFRTQLVRSDGPYRDMHDVLLDVVESSAYTISYGLGYQREEQNRGSIRGSFEISNSNLFGRLQSASLILRVSRREQLGQVSYQFPRPFGLQWPLLGSIFYQRLQQASFGSDRRTALIQVERRQTTATTWIFRYQFEDVKIFDLQISGSDLQRNDQPVQLGRLSTTYLRDTRDSALDATAGAFSVADVSFASTKLGGTERYVRFFGQHQIFRTLKPFPSVVWASSARVGLAKPYGGSVSLPISERFFTGGSNTLRGLDFEQGGPRDPKTDQPTGGNALVVLNTELRFPLLTRLNLQGAAFYDTGNVFKTVNDIRLGGFTNTIGAGVRIKTPLGPFRVDFGYLIDPPAFVASPGNQKLSKFQIHFSFGQAF